MVGRSTRSSSWELPTGTLRRRRGRPRRRRRPVLTVASDREKGGADLPLRYSLRLLDINELSRWPEIDQGIIDSLVVERVEKFA
jgi:hypothetical protein